MGQAHNILHIVCRIRRRGGHSVACRAIICSIGYLHVMLSSVVSFFRDSLSYTHLITLNLLEAELYYGRNNVHQLFSCFLLRFEWTWWGSTNTKCPLSERNDVLARLFRVWLIRQLYLRITTTNVAPISGFPENDGNYFYSRRRA
jgi:hypothetical protein